MRVKKDQEKTKLARCQVYSITYQKQNKFNDIGTREFVVVLKNVRLYNLNTRWGRSVNYFKAVIGSVQYAEFFQKLEHHLKKTTNSSDIRNFVKQDTHLNIPVISFQTTTFCKFKDASNDREIELPKTTYIASATIHLCISYSMIFNNCLKTGIRINFYHEPQIKFF